jgi:GntR family transcriptional regulator
MSTMSPADNGPGDSPRPLRPSNRPRGLPDDCVQQLTEAINHQVFPRGSQLPSEADLAIQLGVSRATLREALRILADRHLIVRRHGLGTFVAEELIEKTLHRNFGITAMIRGAGYRPSTASQQVAVTHPDEEAVKALRLSPDDQVIVLERVRLADKRPVVYSLDVIARSLVGVQDLKLLSEEQTSLYGLLHRVCDITIYRGQAELLPVKANSELAFRLDVRRGAPLMCIKQTDFDAHGRPVLYSVEYHVADWVRFTVERFGPGSATDE